MRYDYGTSMIASLLPGLRDLRTPLAVGYLWLVGLWLLLHDRVPSSASAPISSLYDLSAFLGTSAVLAAITFVAYLLGSILLFAPGPYKFRLQRGVGTRMDRKVNDLFRWRRMATITNIGALDNMINQLEEFVGEWLKVKAASLTVEQQLDAITPKVLSRYSTSGAGQLEILKKVYTAAILEDLLTVGIRLQAKNRDFWDTYDRKSAESQFRFAVILPIFFFIIVATIESSPLWLIALPILVALAWLSIRLRVHAAYTLIQAVTLEMVQPPVLARLKHKVQEQDAQRTATASTQPASTAIQP